MGEDNIELLKSRGVKTIITTIPRYDVWLFGTIILEAAMTTYAEKGGSLSDEELNGLIEVVGLRPGAVKM